MEGDTQAAKEQSTQQILGTVKQLMKTPEMQDIINNTVAAAGHAPTPPLDAAAATDAPAESSDAPAESSDAAAATAAPTASSDTPAESSDAAAAAEPPALGEDPDAVRMALGNTLEQQEAELKGLTDQPEPTDPAELEAFNKKKEELKTAIAESTKKLADIKGGRRRTKHKKFHKKGGKKSHKKGKSSKKVAKRRKSRKTGSRRSRKQNKH